MHRALIAAVVFGFMAVHRAFPQESTRGIRLKAVERLSGSDSERPTFHLLLIGISNYQDPKWQTLETPVNDAKALRDLLFERYHFGPGNTVELYDKDATCSNIHKALQGLTALSAANDSVLIYFAGHGHEDGYWIPHNGSTQNRSSWIYGDDMRRQIKDWSARHVLVVSDSCFSGDFLMAQRGSAAGEMPSDIRRRYSRKSRFALSSGGSEPVKDAGINRDHSIFAHFLLECLRSNRRRFVTPSDPDVFGHLRDGLAANPFKVPQTPQYRQILDAGSVSGEFVFILADEYCDPAYDTAFDRMVSSDSTISTSDHSADDDWLAGAANETRTASILVTSPAAGRLRIGMNSHQLDGLTEVRLNEGSHRFVLELPDQDRIFGTLNVGPITDEAAITQFGLGEGIFFKKSHITAAQEGRPVRYSVSLQGINGQQEIISYMMSLRRIR